MALNQQDIDVGAAPNDGQGDPIRTAFIKCNDNFTQLYSLPNPTPPTTLIGVAGDIPGMYAYDDTYFYYCYLPYDGVSVIWGQLIQSDEAASSIGNGTSNVKIAISGGPITMSVANVANVVTVTNNSLTVRGALNSNTIATGSLVSGNFIVSGDTISSLGETITITPAGNVIYGDVVVNAGFSILGNTTTTEAPVIVLANTAANASVANGAGIQVSQGNVASFLYNSSSSTWDTALGIQSQGLTITNNANITGAFDVYVSNTLNSSNVQAVEYRGNAYYGNSFNGGSFVGNTFAGDAGFVSNVQGANVIGTVPFAQTANFALYSSGTANSNYAAFAGRVISTNQPNITSVGTLTTLNVLGNSSFVGNVNTGGLLSGGGIITAPFMGTANSTVLQGTIGVASNSQPNITQVGTLNFLNSGPISANGNVTVYGNLFADYIFGVLAGTTELAQYVTKPNQSNITSVGTLNGLTMASNAFITGANVVTANIVSANLIGIVGNTIFRGRFGEGSNAQPNITSVGNLVSVNVDGQANFGTSPANTTSINGNTISSGAAGTTINLGYNVIVPGNLNVQGTTVTVNSNTVTINDLFINVANNASSSALANSAGIGVGPVGSEYVSLYYESITDSWNMDAPLYVAGNIYAPSFNWSNGTPVISSNGVLDVASINVTGNIDGTYFNGTAIYSQYADLAENYLADAQYDPGTVVSFGGTKEVTVSTQDLDVLVAGVVSTNPAYTMNSTLDGNFTTPIALMGRVPCRVTGLVTRGAMMVSNGDGTARAEKNPVMGSVIGKALESFDGDVGVIEIVVGKL